MPVVLLCHFDGTAGSTAFWDASGYGHALTPSSVTVSTTAPKFGTGAGDFTSATAGRNIDTGAATEFRLGSGQFTVESWCYVTAALGGVEHDIVAQWGGSSNLGWALGWDASGNLAFYYSPDGATNPFVGTAYTPTLNTWIHIAADRDASNVVRVYVNGVVIASATVTATIFPSTQTFMIGNNHNLDRAYTGYLDEVRVITGRAMYGGAFTPPTAPFSATTTWNPVDKATNIALSGTNNLVASCTSNALGMVRAIDKQVTGKFYWEVTWNALTNANDTVGLASSTASLTGGLTVNATGGQTCGLSQSGAVFVNTGNASPPVNFGAGVIVAGTIVCIAFDAGNRLIWFRLGAAGNWNNSAAANPAAGAGGVSLYLGDGIPAFPAVTFGTSGDQATANFGDTAFTGTVPSGFTAGFTSGVTTPTNAIVTQAGVEEWVTTNALAQVTQVAVEEWVQISPPPSPLPNQRILFKTDDEELTEWYPIVQRRIVPQFAPQFVSRRFRFPFEDEELFDRVVWYPTLRRMAPRPGVRKLRPYFAVSSA
jgi:hypothetical protein